MSQSYFRLMCSHRTKNPDQGKKLLSAIASARTNQKLLGWSTERAIKFVTHSHRLTSEELDFVTKQLTNQPRSNS